MIGDLPQNSAEPMAHPTLRLDGCSVDLDKRLVINDDQTTRLTPKEAALLRYLSEHPGTTVSRDELLREVWGYRGVIKSRTVDTTVRTLRAKIERDRACPSHVVTAHGVGYRFECLELDVESDTPVGSHAEHVPMRTNLGGEVETFFGRKRDLLSLRECMERGTRLVTVMGIRGVGKTRLVREFAARSFEYFGRGGEVWFCDLSSCQDVADINDEVRGAFGGVRAVERSSRDEVERIGRLLSQRRRVLLVLDAFDGVAHHAAETLGRWLELAPEARFLVTCRHRLGLSVEESYVMDRLSAIAALDLVRDRTHRTPAADELLNPIVRLGGGNPLALELLASCVRERGIEEVLKRCDEQVGPWETESAESEDGQPVLRQVMEIWWRSICDWEQQAFAQCGVFIGGFAVAGAEAVLELSACSSAPSGFDALAALLDHKVIHRDRLARGRFGMCQALREFAIEKLGTDRCATEARAARWFLAMAERAAGFGQDGADRWYTMDRPYIPDCQENLGNAVAAYRHFVNVGDAACALRMVRVLVAGVFQNSLDARLTLLKEGRAVWKHLDRDVQPQLYQLYGFIYLALERNDAARAELERVSELVAGTADWRRQVEVADALGCLERLGGRLDDASWSVRRALDVLGARDEPLLRAKVHQGGGVVALAQVIGAPASARATHEEQAERYLRQALNIYRVMNKPGGLSGVLTDLGILRGVQGRFAEASAYLVEAVELTNSLGLRLREGEALRQLGICRHHQGRFREAVHMFRRSIELAERSGDLRHECASHHHLMRLHLDTGDLYRARQHAEQMRKLCAPESKQELLFAVGMLCCVEGNFEAAGDALSFALGASRECHTAPWWPYALLFDACAKAETDALDDAWEQFDRACDPTLARGDTTVQLACDVVRAHLQLVEARRDDLAGAASRRQVLADAIQRSLEHAERVLAEVRWTVGGLEGRMAIQIARKALVMVL